MEAGNTSVTHPCTKCTVNEADHKVVNIELVGNISVTHPCIKCTVNEADYKGISETAQAEVVPTMCLTYNGRIVETIVARLVNTNNSNVDK
jgi:hypothetical protein